MAKKTKPELAPPVEAWRWVCFWGTQAAIVTAGGADEARAIIVGKVGRCAAPGQINVRKATTADLQTFKEFGRK